MLIRDAEVQDVPAITMIYNDAVRNTTAIWNEHEVDDVNRTAWLTDRRSMGYPVLVAIDDDEVVGYASFGDWRPFDGYRHTIEHSVYVRGDQRGNGVGKALMVELIERARGIGKHVMVAGIESGNEASIRLHAQLGFTDAGTLTQVGAKFGTWLDLTFLQLILDDRPTPDAAGS